MGGGAGLCVGLVPRVGAGSVVGLFQSTGLEIYTLSDGAGAGASVGAVVGLFTAELEGSVARLRICAIWT